MRKSLTRAERIRGRAEIHNAFRNSSSVSCRGAKLLYGTNGMRSNRILVVPVRRYGSSVARNRAKRLARESYRNLKQTIVKGYDFVFILYPGYDWSYRARYTQLRALFENAGLIEDQFSSGSA